MAEGITLGRKARRDAMHEADTAGYRWADLPGDLMRIFGTAGRAGIEGMATALSGVDEQGRSVGSILPFAKDERTGEVGLASPRILDLWNTAGGAVPAKGITLGAGPVMRGGGKIAPDGFASWFSGSKLVDDAEEPLVLYHGSPDKAVSEKDFAFQVGGDRPRRTDFGNFGEGVYLTPKRFIAEAYAKLPKGGASGHVLELYASIKNPLEITVAGAEYTDEVSELARKLGVTATPEWRGSGQHNAEWARQFREKAMEAGYDGVVTRNVDGSMGAEVVAFSPEQVKGTNNSGAFDPADPRILASRAAPGSLGVGGDRRLTYRDIEDWL